MLRKISLSSVFNNNALSHASASTLRPFELAATGSGSPSGVFGTSSRVSFTFVSQHFTPNFAPGRRGALEVYSSSVFSFPLASAIRVVISGCRAIVVTTTAPVADPALFHYLGMGGNGPIFLVVLIFAPRHLATSLVFL